LLCIRTTARKRKLQGIGSRCGRAGREWQNLAFVRNSNRFARRSRVGRPCDGLDRVGGYDSNNGTRARPWLASNSSGAEAALARVAASTGRPRRSGLQQPAIARAQRLAAPGLEHRAVRDDDAVEVPAEDALERGACLPAIADEQLLDPGGTETAVAADQAQGEARRKRRRGAEVEGQVADEERAAGPVAEGDLVHARQAFDERLIQLAGPFRRWHVGQHRIEGQIAPLLRQPRRSVEAHLRERALMVADEEMVEAVGRDGEARRAEIQQRGLQRLVEGDRRVEQEAAVAQPYDGHARAEREAVEAQRAFDDPEILGELAHGRGCTTPCSRWPPGRGGMLAGAGRAMHFDVDASTIALVVSGSHAYGMGTEASDVDLRGVCVPPRSIRESYFKRFEQWQSSAQVGPWGESSRAAIEKLTGTAAASYRTHGSTADVTVFALSKFVGLAAAANPNVLELLFVDDEARLQSSAAWERLLEHRELFLSQKCRHTYSGYAHAQLRKIQSHRAWLVEPPMAEPSRAGFGLPEQSVLDAGARAQIDEAVTATIRQWGVEDGLDDVLTGAALDVLRERMLELQQAALGVSREELDDALHRAAARSLGLSADVLAVLAAERAYRKARKHWQQYVAWQRNRNPARAELEAEHGYDTKHASHLLRLMRTGTEVLRDGVLRVRRPDAEELLAIRRGALSYEEVIAMAGAEEQAMRRAAETTTLPRSAPAEQIDAVLLEILAEHDGYDEPSRRRLLATARPS
jgi:predicted nucleotidyltransferase